MPIRLLCCVIRVSGCLVTRCWSSPVNYFVVHGNEQVILVKNSSGEVCTESSTFSCFCGISSRIRHRMSHIFFANLQFACNTRGLVTSNRVRRAFLRPPCGMQIISLIEPSIFSPTEHTRKAGGKVEVSVVAGESVRCLVEFLLVRPLFYFGALQMLLED